MYCIWHTLSNVFYNIFFAPQQANPAQCNDKAMNP